MCVTCGCDDPAGTRIGGEAMAPPLGTGPGGPGETETLELEERLLAKNDDAAAASRARQTALGITVLNVMSSPGAGKTSLLERTVAERALVGAGRREMCVVEGDQETSYDADRIRRAGARAVQINTGASCHLDAEMVGSALRRLAPPPGSLVFVENVGNLVCPALFDVGEAARVVVVSVTEGHDKPLKYPHMFAAADLVVVNKTDLVPYLDWDHAAFVADARRLNPGVEVLALSVRDGDGVDAWYRWLADRTVPPDHHAHQDGHAQPAGGGR